MRIHQVPAASFLLTAACLAQPDRIPPTTPRGVTGHGVSGTAIELTWWPSQDNHGIRHYRIRRNNAVVGTANTNYFLDTDLAPNRAYNYTVTAVDPAGNESLPSTVRGGYSSGVFTTLGGTVAISIVESPEFVRPGEPFRLAWQVNLDPAGALGHNDAHVNESLDNFGCNPPACEYVQIRTRAGNVYYAEPAAPSATGDLYWMPDPHPNSPTSAYNNEHQHYPLRRIVVSRGNPLAIATTALPPARPGERYSFTITHNNSEEARGPFATGISQGALPAGLNIDAGSAMIDGTPNEAGAFPFTVRVKAASENYAWRDLVLTVGAPQFNAAAVTNGASFLSGAAPGAIATVFGVALSDAAGIVQAESAPLPAGLRGTSVTVNGVPAPLYGIANVDGREQINFQIPYEAAERPAASIVIDNRGLTSAPVAVPVLPALPGIFAAAGDATPGGVLAIYATGLGLVRPAVPTGLPAPSAPLSETLITPVVTLGGFVCQTLFSGLAPGFVGLNQVNVRVPPGLPAGEYELVLLAADQSSNPVRVPVR